MNKPDPTKPRPRDPSKPKNTKRHSRSRKKAAKAARKAKQGHQPQPAQEYRRPRQQRRPGGQQMTNPKTAKRTTPPRTTPRTPAPRLVFEVTPRKNGKAARPLLLEAKDSADLAERLAEALKLTDQAAKAAAVMLAEGATIQAETWTGRAIGVMQFRTLEEARQDEAKKAEAQEAAQAGQAQTPTVGAGLDAAEVAEGESGSPAPTDHSAKDDQAAQHTPELAYRPHSMEE